MDRRFFAIILIIVAGLGGIFWLSKDKAATPATLGQVSNHTQGAGKKGVTLIEYGDFQCPACGQYFPIVKQVKEKFGEDITFQFRNFPLSQIHPKAFAAHRAAEAAGMQGKFFEMHNLLYERQNIWSQASNATATFETYAQELGLDLAKFKVDFVSEQVNATINADIKAGQELGANSTPTFILDGNKIQNPRGLEEFEKVIDDAIAAKAGTPTNQ